MKKIIRLSFAIIAIAALAGLSSCNTTQSDNTHADHQSQKQAGNQHMHY